MLKKINALVVTTLILSACSNPSITPNEPNHSATGGDPLPSGTILIDPSNPTSPPYVSNPSPAPVISSGATFSGNTHRVVGGDTLFSLAKRYRVTVQELMSWNHLSSPSALKVGQLLRIHSSSAQTVAPIAKNYPTKSKTYHAVKRGETLYRVARLYRQSVGNLAKWNGLRKSSRLKVGQKLRVRP
jgi:LysM repeat protein